MQRTSKNDAQTTSISSVDENIPQFTAKVKTKYSVRDNLKDDLEKVKNCQFSFKNSDGSWRQRSC